MPFPFGKSQKSPAEIVRNLRENVTHMEKLDAGDSKKGEKVGNVFFYYYYFPAAYLVFKNLLFSTLTTNCCH